MLRNKLAVLIAERELTAAKVSEETGIARSTLSSLVNNTGDGVQYKTLDKLCNYFGITPSEFFDYAPFILKYNLDIPEYRRSPIEDIDSEKENLLSLGNTEERANFLINQHLDIFGDTRYIIEIFVNKKMKQIKY
ncbi:helix-turn-helix transcriptional regulator, partial [Enterococcus hirae]